MEEVKLRTLSVWWTMRRAFCPRCPGCSPARGSTWSPWRWGATANPAISRMTIEVLANENQTNLMCNQLAKMVPVHSVKLLNPSHSIRRELVLYKVRAKSSDDKMRSFKLPTYSGAPSSMCPKKTLTLSVIGDEKKTDAVQELLAEFGIVELCAPA